MASGITLVGAPVTGTGVTTLSINPTAIGNAVALFVKISSGTATVSSVSGGNCTNWQRIAGPSVDTGGTAHTHEIWLGVATATGAQTLTVANTLSAAMDLDAQQASSTAGSVWAKDGSQEGFLNNASSVTVTLPTLVPTASAWYFGHARCPTGSGYSAPTSGYTLTSDANTNPILTNADVTGSQSPVCTSAATLSYAIGVLIVAGQVPYASPYPQILPQ